MQTHIETTHRHLGELAAMSRQTQEAERKILARAQERLQQVETELTAARTDALAGGGDRYMALIQERGQLHQVVAQARQVLGS